MGAGDRCWPWGVLQLALHSRSSRCFLSPSGLWARHGAPSSSSGLSFPSPGLSHFSRVWLAAWRQRLGAYSWGGGGGSWETSCHRQSLPGRPPRPPVLSSQPAYGGPGPPRVGMFAPDHQLCWQISRGGTCRAASTGLRGMSGALRRGYGGHTPGTLALRSRCRGRWPQCARPCWGLDRC